MKMTVLSSKRFNSRGKESVLPMRNLCYRLVFLVGLLPSIGNAQVVTGGPQPSVTPTVQTVYALQGGLDGFQPESGVIRDGKGNLYGATIQGGNYAEGTVYKLIPPAAGSTIWTHNVLYSFPAYSGDGIWPVGSLVLDSSGALYGTTYEGGLYGGGTVFKLTPPIAEGDTWTETILYSFSASGLQNLQGLAEDTQGNLYGSGMYYDDARRYGGVFQLSPPTEPGGPWQETTLYVFSGAPEPALPSANLTFDSAGNLYGASNSGGASDLGTPPRTPSAPAPAPTCLQQRRSVRPRYRLPVESTKRAGRPMDRYDPI